MGCYFLDYQSKDYATQEGRILAEQRGIVGKFENMVTVIAMSLGWLGKQNEVLTAAILIIFTSVSALILAIAWTRKPTERNRAAALFALFLGTAFVVGGVSWGRAYIVGEHLWYTNRYASLSVPLLIGIYLTSIFFVPHVVARCTQAVLCMVSAIVFVGHTVDARDYPYALKFATRIRLDEESFVRAALDGVPDDQLIQNIPGWRSNIAGYISVVQMMRGARIGPYGMSATQRSRYLQFWDPCKGHVLSLADSGCDPYLSLSWNSAPEPPGRWTTGSSAGVRFSAEPEQTRCLTMCLVPFIAPGVKCQHVRVLLNDVEINILTLDQSMLYQNIAVILPGHLVRGRNQIKFLLPDAIAPKEVSENADPRVLGIFVHSLRID
jgi:hypothetical protein